MFDSKVAFRRPMTGGAMWPSGTFSDNGEAAANVVGSLRQRPSPSFSISLRRFLIDTMAEGTIIEVYTEGKVLMVKC
jgi:hypothetical protein